MTAREAGLEAEPGDPRATHGDDCDRQHHRLAIVRFESVIAKTETYTGLTR